MMGVYVVAWDGKKNADSDAIGLGRSRRSVVIPTGRAHATEPGTRKTLCGNGVGYQTKTAWGPDQPAGCDECRELVAAG